MTTVEEDHLQVLGELETVKQGLPARGELELLKAQVKACMDTLAELKQRYDQV